MREANRSQVILLGFLAVVGPGIIVRLNAPALLALNERQQSSKRAAAMAEESLVSRSISAMVLPSSGR